MLEKLADWYKVVSIDADSALIGKREKAIKKIIEMLEGGKNKDALQLAAVESIVSKSGVNDELAEQMIKKIKQHDKTYTSDPNKVQMELKVICAVAIGEIMQNGDSTGWTSTLLAGCLTSALGIRKKPSEEKYGDILTKLLVLANKTLENNAIQVRDASEEAPEDKSLNISNRFSTLQHKLEQEPPPDHHHLWKKLSPDIQSIFQIQQDNYQQTVDFLSSNLSIVMEELNILWWHYGGRTRNTHEIFSSMSPGRCVLLTAHDMVQLLVHIPPSTAFIHLLGDAVLKGRDDTTKKVSLTTIIDNWDIETLNTIDILSENSDLISTNPVIFPISWLIDRFYKDGSISSWKQIFTQKTGISSSTKLELTEWSSQIFREQVLIHIYLIANEE